MTVYKFPVSPGHADIMLPRGAKILSTAAQRGDICIWVLCDPAQPKERRKLAVFPTGVDIDVRGMVFVGTAIMANGDLVFHVFAEDVEN